MFRIINHRAIKFVKQYPTIPMKELLKRRLKAVKKHLIKHLLYLDTAHIGPQIQSQNVSQSVHLSTTAWEFSCRGSWWHCQFGSTTQQRKKTYPTHKQIKFHQILRLCPIDQYLFTYLIGDLKNISHFYTWRQSNDQQQVYTSRPSHVWPGKCSMRCPHSQRLVAFVRSLCASAPRWCT